MYICLCHGVTDKEIKRAVCQGACSMRMLATELKVATQCGKCKPMAKQILKETLAEQNTPLKPLGPEPSPAT